MSPNSTLIILFDLCGYVRYISDVATQITHLEQQLRVAEDDINKLISEVSTTTFCTMPIPPI